MKERLQKILSSSGYCSRRKAEELINRGEVTVNGIKAVIGQSADPETDIITAEGHRISINPGYVYIMLNKPKGYVTTLSDERGRKCITELISDIPERVFPVGRLDMYSEGLLLLTNDGETANKLMHPVYGISKTYEVISNEHITDEQAAYLRGSIDVDGVIVKAKEVTRGKYGDTLYITITEGRNRQIRKMCAKAGVKIRNLKRISEGSLKLGDLKQGTWRYLTDTEINELKNI